jgi:type I protein arginine methyltransferase
MNNTLTYSLYDYGWMIADLPRTDAYVQALRQSLKPGDIVLDIGSGPGLFALVACQMGAGKVYALEPDHSILVASEIARENGFANRIEFIQDISTSVTLPRPADLIISDLRGVLPIFGSHLGTIIDARQRLLAPDGVLIPQKDILHVAIVEDSKTYQGFSSPWQDQPYQLNMQAALKYALNGWQKAKLTPDQLLTFPQAWASLDYRSLTQTSIQGEASLTILRAGIAHGLGIWFDTELIEGVGFSNAPGQPQLIYGQAFFPFMAPLDVQAGDVLQVNLRADMVGRDYEWTWKTRCCPGGHTGKLEWDFEQSTFYHTPVSMDGLKHIAASYTPGLSQEGLITRFMLDKMNGSTPLEEIARAAAEHFPERFPDWKAALARAGELSEKYTR